jgi:hypothetical protein
MNNSSQNNGEYKRLRIIMRCQENSWLITYSNKTPQKTFDRYQRFGPFAEF